MEFTDISALLDKKPNAAQQELIRQRGIPSNQVLTHTEILAMVHSIIELQLHAVNNPAEKGDQGTLIFRSSSAPLETRYGYHTLDKSSLTFEENLRAVEVADYVLYNSQLYIVIGVFDNYINVGFVFNLKGDPGDTTECESIVSTIRDEIQQMILSPDIDAAFAAKLAEHSASIQELNAIKQLVGSMLVGKDFSDELEDLDPTFLTRLRNVERQAASTAEDVTILKDSVTRLNELFGEGVEGYVRVSGVSDPEFRYREFKHTVGAESVFDCIKPCLVGNNYTGSVGHILHVLNPLNWYEDERGNPRKLDGTEGEVLICNTRSVWEIAQHVTVGSVTYDVFLRSLEPFEWMGHPAREIKPMGVSPHYCVAHKDSDNVTRMHSVYNPEWIGSHSPQQTIKGLFRWSYDANGELVETYDADAVVFADGAGLFSTDLALYTGEQYAMNLNNDASLTWPYMNATARSVEVMYAAMVAEGGTFDAHNCRLMGSGFSCNDYPSTEAQWSEANPEARNGIRYQKPDGTWVMTNLSRRGSTGFNPSKTGDWQYSATFVNNWRGVWSCMEQQRVLMYAIEHNVPELTWFAYNGFRYKWRHVDGFAGPSEKVMTAVVWKLIESKFEDGCVDSVTGLNVSGLRFEMMVSSAIYRGQITDVSPSWWTSGLLFTFDSDGHCNAYVQRDQHQLMKTPSNVTATDWLFTELYHHVGEYKNTNAYRTDYNDDALMLPRNKDCQGTASLHNYVGGYQYLSTTLPSPGSLALRGFRRGYYANGSYLSPLCVNGIYSPTNASSACAFGICCEIESSGS